MDESKLLEMYGLIKEMHGQLIKSDFVKETKEAITDYRQFKETRRNTCPFQGDKAIKNRQWWVAIIVSNIMTIGVTWWRSHIGG